MSCLRWVSVCLHVPVNRKACHTDAQLCMTRPDAHTPLAERLQLKRDAAILARKAAKQQQQQPDAAAQAQHLAAAEAGLRKAAAAEKARAAARKAEEPAGAERAQEAQRAHQQQGRVNGDRVQGSKYVGDDPFNYLPKGISIEDFQFD